MSHKPTSAVLVAMLLLGAFTVALVAAEEPLPPSAADYSEPEEEPNNCFPYNTWHGIGVGDPRTYTGTINPVGDVDYLIHFSNSFARTLAVDWQLPAGSPLRGVVGLYNDDGELLVESACGRNGNCLRYTFTTPDEYYYLKVAGTTTAGGPAYGYEITVELLDETDFGEPNDTLARATPVHLTGYPDYYNDPVRGKLAGCDDVDTYTFTGAAGDVITVYAWYLNWELLDAGGNVVAANYYPSYVRLPANGTYYLRVTGECDQTYELSLGLVEHEPNDTVGQATPLVLSEAAVTAGSGLHLPCDDVDYFTFTGRAGDEIRVDRDRYRSLQLLDAAQNVLAEIKSPKNDTLYATLPADGAYYLRLANDRQRCDEDEYYLRLHLIDQPLYLSFDKPGQVAGIPFTSGDVLRHWQHTGRWEMYMDMSTAGLNGNLTALLMGDDRLLAGFADTFKVNGVGTFPAHDLVQIDNFALGCVSPGFDGSDVGLSTRGERIDTAASNPDTNESSNGPVLLGMTGRASVPFGLGNMSFPKEDLVRFRPGSFGPNTFGNWEPFFDGSSYGLGAANVIAADAAQAMNDRNGTWVDTLWLSLDRPVTLGGVAFAPGDIARCDDSAFDHRNPCLSVSKFFDISDAGMAGLRVDALEVGPRE